MKLIFMGTPDFAKFALEAIVEAGHQVTCVITQPDKPKGRGKEIQMSPVKAYAISKGLPVFQPSKIKDAEAVEKLKNYEADIFVVAAFGQILSEEILNMPPLGCINIHASLLPKYRGAAPIQWAIMNGDKKTGITIMNMEKTLDTGDMLLKKEVSIDPKETDETLHDKLCEAGATLIVEALPLIEAGSITPEPQNNGEATYVSILKKSQGEIDWERDAAEIERLVRGLNSWPSAYTNYAGRVLKIWESEEVYADRKNRPGVIERVEKDAIYVGTGQGFLKITNVQLEGKKRMNVSEFLRGCPLEVGIILGG